MGKLSQIPDGYTSAKTVKLTKSKLDRRRESYFFLAMAILFLIVAFMGFFPSIQMMKAGSLEVHWLTHVHGAVMTSWLLLFLTQNILTVTGNLKFHRRLGRLSVVLAVLIFIMLGVVSFNHIIYYNAPEDSSGFDLLIGGFYEMFGFALFFTWGMLSRKKNLSAHKRLLAMATIVLLEAAVDRIQLRNAFPSFGLAYPATNFIYADILYIPLFLYDWITLKKIHKVTVQGTAIVLACQLLVCTFYGSPSWHKFWYAQTAPLMNKVVEVQLTEVQRTALIGHYHSDFGNIIISEDNGKLYGQINGEQKQELGASSATTLFSKQESIQFSFVKNSVGKVESAKVEQNGRMYTMTRIDLP